VAKKDMNPRTCIVSREELLPDEMIRFVLDPQTRVVPDLKRKLPGRGVWIKLNRTLVEQAVSKGYFARGFKNKVVAEDILPQLVDDLMQAAVLNTLAMAKKAGLVVPGQAKAELAIRSGESGLLFSASDAGADGAKKLTSAVKSQKLYEGMDIPVFAGFTSDQLDQAIGGTNVMHVAVLTGGMTVSLINLVERLMRYRGSSDA